MKQFLIRVAVFLLPIAVLLYPLDILLSKWYKMTHRYPGELEVWNAIYDGTAQCDMAVYGSSRAWVQIDPAILSDSLHCKVYNFGMDGQNFLMQYMRHSEFVKHNPFPKHIVLSVDVFSLAKKDGIYEVKQFLPYVLWNRNMASVTVHEHGFKWVDPFIPLVRYSGYGDVLRQIETNAREGESQEQYRTNGYRGMDRTWSNDYKKATEQQASLQLEIDPAIQLKLESLIRECKEAGGNLTFVYCPEHILGQQYVTNRAEIINTFRTIAQQNGIQFLDYSYLPICNDTSYFYNASHLNRAGSMLFSTELASDLKRVYK